MPHGEAVLLAPQIATLCKCTGPAAESDDAESIRDTIPDCDDSERGECACTWPELGHVSDCPLRPWLGEGDDE